MIGKIIIFLIKLAAIIIIPYLFWNYLRQAGAQIAMLVFQLVGIPNSRIADIIGTGFYRFGEAFAPGLIFLAIGSILYRLGVWGTRAQIWIAAVIVAALAFITPYSDLIAKVHLVSNIFDRPWLVYYSTVADGVSWVSAGLAALLLLGFGRTIAAAPRRFRRIAGRHILVDGPWRDRWATLFETWWRYRAADGLILGERYRRDLEPNWSDHPLSALVTALPIALRGGGHAGLLRVAPKGHLLTVAGSGGGKSSGYAIPNLLLCRKTGFIVLDVSGELWRETAAVRELMGRRVVYLDPTDESTWGVNVCAAFGHNPATLDTDIKKICGWLKANQKPAAGGSGAMFSTLGWALVQGVMLYLAETRGPGNWTLGDVAAIIQQPGPSLDAELTAMYGASSVARQSLGQVMGITAAETRAGVFANAASYLDVFASPSGNRMLSGTAERVFALSDLLDGRTDLYIRMPRDVIPMYGGGLQLLIGAINSTIEARGRKLDTTLVYLLDEFPQIAGAGKGCVVMSGIETMRKWNVVYWLFAQSRSQYFDVYGDQRGKVLEDSCYCRMYLAIEEETTARMLSEACGNVTVLQESLSLSEGGSRPAYQVSAGQASEQSSRSEQGVKEPLLPLAEVRRMAVDGGQIPDEQVILQRGRRPVRCGVARWYRRAEMRYLHALGRRHGVRGPHLVPVDGRGLAGEALG
jgi:type IV secretion system protein VirD4